MESTTTMRRWVVVVVTGCGVRVPLRLVVCSASCQCVWHRAADRGAGMHAGTTAEGRTPRALRVADPEGRMS